MNDKDRSPTHDAMTEPEATFAAAVLLASEDVRRELAVMFQVSTATANRWASGVAKPHPQIQELPLAFLKERGIEVVVGKGATPPARTKKARL